jgi:hypothetical protein
MANSRNYRTPTTDDDPDVPYWTDLLAQDVAEDVDTLELSSRRLQDVPGYLEVFIDKIGRSPLQITDDGHVSGNAFDIGSATVTELAGAACRAGVDPAGRRDESEIGPDGRVPAWILAEWKTRMGAVTGSAGYDIIIGAGQSNAVQSDTTLPVFDVHPRIFRLTGTTIEPMPAEDIYLLPAFAREYAKTTDRKVLIVPAAVGSTGFTTTSVNPPAAGYSYVPGGGTWDRTLVSDPLNLAALMISKAQAALTAGGTGSAIKAILWSQGEADTPVLNEAAYAAKLDDLISWSRTELGLPSLPWIIGSLVPEDTDLNRNTYTLGVSAALSDTPRRVQHTAFVYGPRGHTQHLTPIHWSTAGQIERGAMFLAGYYRARANFNTAKPEPPQLLRITRSGTDVEISWSPALTRTVSQLVQYSTDSGATWTPATIVTTSRLQAFVTIAAALPVWVRASGTNEVGTSLTTTAKG